MMMRRMRKRKTPADRGEAKDQQRVAADPLGGDAGGQVVHGVLSTHGPASESAVVPVMQAKPVTKAPRYRRK